MTQAVPGAPVQQAGSPIRTVAVIGAGIAGRSFAFLAAGVGFHVILEDVMPSNLRKAEEDYSIGASTGHLSFALTVEDAVRDADLAIDFVPDELESKLEIFSMIDRMAPPRTILCTPSDALSITDLASCVYRPDRCFALRGSLASPQYSGEAKLRLLHPAAHLPAVLSSAVNFFQLLGFSVTTEADPDAPMLMKNLAAYVPTNS